MKIAEINKITGAVLDKDLQTLPPPPPKKEPF